MDSRYSTFVYLTYLAYLTTRLLASLLSLSSISALSLALFAAIALPLAIAYVLGLGLRTLVEDETVVRVITGKLFFRLPDGIAFRNEPRGILHRIVID